jgi:hypothetical protein
VLGAGFWRWWKRAWVGGEEREAPAVKEEEQVLAVADADAKVSMTPAQEFVHIAAVVPRPRPPRRPAKSKPIDIPTKKAASVPVFEVAEDKRYWYQ